MPTSISSHRRTHNLLLINRLLSLQDNASPFTLILDTLEQTSHRLIEEVISRAKKSKAHTIYLSFETHTPPRGIQVFIKGRRKTAPAIVKEVSEAASTTSKTLLIIDTLPTPHLATPQTLLLPLLSLSQPAQSPLSIFLTHHADIPAPPPSPSTPHTPSPLTLLSYLATTVITLHSFAQALAKKRARDRSLPEPVFGLEEEREGIVIGLIEGRGGEDGGFGGGVDGVVLDVEFRRKSGRGVGEVYLLLLPPPPPPPAQTPSTTSLPHPKSEITLLDEHPLMRAPPTAGDEEVADQGGEEEGLSTFKLELSERQRRDREGVVLPYFDAQRVGGAVGEGGRILYEMGREDDFDEEEDEI